MKPAAASETLALILLVGALIAHVAVRTIMANHR
jgi:hypothetical protein